MVNLQDQGLHAFIYFVSEENIEGSIIKVHVFHISIRFDRIFCLESKRVDEIEHILM